MVSLFLFVMRTTVDTVELIPPQTEEFKDRALTSLSQAQSYALNQIQVI